MHDIDLIDILNTKVPLSASPTTSPLIDVFNILTAFNRNCSPCGKAHS